MAIDRHRLLLGLGLTVLMAGCSPVDYSVRHVMVPLLENSREAAFLSDDMRTFGDASASNLFLLEGMIHTDSENSDLRLTASMLYFSYAFAFQEDTDPEYASLLYGKGLKHAWYALLLDSDLPLDRDMPYSEFEVLVPQLEADAVPAAVWVAVNWSQYINLHLDDTSVMRAVPKVQALLERVIELDGTFFEGMPYVLAGSLHAFKPPMMGGDTDASLANFESAFAVSGNSFLLAQYFYARFYTYRMMDEALFTQTLEEVIAAEVVEGDPYRLLNLIAQDKSRQLLEEAYDLF